MSIAESSNEPGYGEEDVGSPGGNFTLSHSSSYSGHQGGGGTSQRPPVHLGSHPFQSSTPSTPAPQAAGSHHHPHHPRNQL